MPRTLGWPERTKDRDKRRARQRGAKRGGDGDGDGDGDGLQILCAMCTPAPRGCRGASGIGPAGRGVGSRYVQPHALHRTARPLLSRAPTANRQPPPALLGFAPPGSPASLGRSGHVPRAVGFGAATAALRAQAANLGEAKGHRHRFAVFHVVVAEECGRHKEHVVVVHAVRGARVRACSPRLAVRRGGSGTAAAAAARARPPQRAAERRARWARAVAGPGRWPGGATWRRAVQDARCRRATQPGVVRELGAPRRARACAAAPVASQRCRPAGGPPVQRKRGAWARGACHDRGTAAASGVRHGPLRQRLGGARLRRPADQGQAHRAPEQVRRVLRARRGARLLPPARCRPGEGHARPHDTRSVPPPSEAMLGTLLAWLHPPPCLPCRVAAPAGGTGPRAHPAHGDQPAPRPSWRDVTSVVKSQRPLGDRLCAYVHVQLCATLHPRKAQRKEGGRARWLHTLNPFLGIGEPRENLFLELASLERIEAPIRHEIPRPPSTRHLLHSEMITKEEPMRDRFVP